MLGVLRADIGLEIWSINNPFISHPFISHPFISHPFISHPFISHPFISHPLISHPLISHPLISHPFISHPFISHPLIHRWKWLCCDLDEDDGKEQPPTIGGARGVQQVTGANALRPTGRGSGSGGGGGGGSRLASAPLPADGDMEAWNVRLSYITLHIITLIHDPSQPTPHHHSNNPLHFTPPPPPWLPYCALTVLVTILIHHYQTHSPSPYSFTITILIAGENPQVGGRAALRGVYGGREADLTITMPPLLCVQVMC